jgi:hypothetical protein
MSRPRRIAVQLLQGLAAGLLVTAPAASLAPVSALAAETEIRLFRVVTMREDLVLGLTPAELAGLGPGPEVERVARRIATEGQLTAWRYVVGRAPDGSTRLATRHRIAVLKQDALMVEPYVPALPVVPPPAE